MTLNFESVLAIFVGISGIWWNHRSRVQGQFDRTQSLLAEAHSDRLALIRHNFGSMLEGVGQDSTVFEGHLSEEDTRDLFAMLWFFQRTWAVYRSFDGSFNRSINYLFDRPSMLSNTLLARFFPRKTQTQRYLLDSLCPEIDVWTQYLALLASRAYGPNGNRLNFSKSRLGLQNLSKLI